MTELDPIYHGSDENIRVTVKEDGSAVDITGWSITLRIKKKLNDADDDALYSQANSSHTDPAGGISDFAIAKETVNGWEPDRYYIGLQVTDDQGKDRSTPPMYIQVKKDV